jgi:hypothetical protein
MLLQFFLSQKSSIDNYLKVTPWSKPWQMCFLVDLWPWKSIGFQTLLMTKYVPSLVKIHWRMLILECSQGYYAVKIWPCDLDLWPWKPIGFQILIRTKYVPSLVKIHCRMLILECSQGLWRTDGLTDYIPSIYCCSDLILSINAVFQLS